MKICILTCAAITRCLSAISVHLAHTQSLQRQYRLCPFRAETTPWFLHLAHLGVRCWTKINCWNFFHYKSEAYICNVLGKCFINPILYICSNLTMGTFTLIAIQTEYRKYYIRLQNYKMEKKNVNNSQAVIVHSITIDIGYAEP